MLLLEYKQHSKPTLETQKNKDLLKITTQTDKESKALIKLPEKNSAPKLSDMSPKIFPSKVLKHNKPPKLPKHLAITAGAA